MYDLAGARLLGVHRSYFATQRRLVRVGYEMLQVELGPPECHVRSLERTCLGTLSAQRILVQGGACTVP